MKDIRNSKKKGPHVKAQFFVCDKGISKVVLMANSENKAFEWSVIPGRAAPHVVGLIDQWVGNYVKGREPAVALPIILDGLPPYTLRVLSILRELPIGVTLTYRELAEVTDNPLGARAVGNACGRNPCPLIIPCHRVLAAGGGLGGFSCGIDIKKTLLQFEGVNID